jgi:vesicle coat complex subunit
MAHRLQFLLAMIIAAGSPFLGCKREPPHDRAYFVSYFLTQAKSDSSSARANAAWELGRLRPPEIPAIRELLQDKDDSVRLTAMSSLASAGPAGIPPLLELLKDEQSRHKDNNRSPSSQRVVVLQLLGAVKAKAAIPALTESLKDKDHEVRMTAACSLGLIGPEAKTAIPDLIDLFKDDDRQVRYSAMSALGGIGLEAKNAVPILSKHLHDKDGLVRCGAAAGLWGIGKSPEAEAAQTVIIELLKDKDRTIRSTAAHMLGEKGPKAESAIPALIALLSDKEVPVQCSAAWALGEIGSKAKVAVPALTDLLDEDKALQITVVIALGRIGPEAGTAIPTLRRLLNDKDSDIRGLARDALQKIKPEQK